MAHRIVSWGDHENCLSQVLSSAASVVSFDSTFSEMDSTHSQMPSTASEAPELHSADFEATHHKGRKALRGEQATPDDSYLVRHDEYFFEDGNVTFLVCCVLWFAYPMN